MMNNTKTMPSVFSGHGSPMNAIGNNRARAGWKAVGEYIGKPKAIVAISSHWMTHGTKVRTAPDNPAVYDMYGFPQELYDVKYEPANNTELAERVIDLIDAEEDNDWGIDHGVWSVLSNMYPDADVPVVMVSTDVDASMEDLYAMGQKLSVLREEGIMIFASGNIVHNLRMVDWDNPNGAAWADTFDTTIRDAVRKGYFKAALNYDQLPDAEKAVPTREHMQPFAVALGAAKGASAVRVFNEYRELGSMSMTSYLFENEEEKN